MLTSKAWNLIKPFASLDFCQMLSASFLVDLIVRNNCPEIQVSKISILF